MLQVSSVVSDIQSSPVNLLLFATSVPDHSQGCTPCGDCVHRVALVELNKSPCSNTTPPPISSEDMVVCCFDDKDDDIVVMMMITVSWGLC